MHLKTLFSLLCLSAAASSATAIPRARAPGDVLVRRWDNTSAASTASEVVKVRSKAASTASTYTFTSNSHRNLAVYFGKTTISLQTNLTVQCADPNIDIVILGFLLNVLGPGNLPTMALNSTAGELCEAPNASMLAAGGTGLKRCASLQSQILACQDLGKKVFISVGGAKGTQTFGSVADAEKAAGVLWDLFGSGTGQNASLRPFGESVTVDGFDVDNETGNGSYYVEFATKLRALTKTQTAKDYFLSAAPACYYPTGGAPIAMLTLMDFVWPQFYAAPSCNIGTANFSSSLAAWSSRLDTGNKPRLFIGGASWINATSTGGYVPPQQLNQTILASVDAIGTTKFGGVMLWDAAYGHVTTDPVTGLDIIGVAKGSLLMSAAGKIQGRMTGPVLVAVAAAVAGLGFKI